MGRHGGWKTRLRSRRFAVETVLALLSGAAGLATLFWPRWLEVAGLEPDHGEGSVEWMLTAAFLLVALALGLFGELKTSNVRSTDVLGARRED